MTTSTPAPATAAQRLDQINSDVESLRAEQTQNQQLYSAAVSNTDGAVMAHTRIRAIELEENLAALELKAQAALIDDAEERQHALGAQQEDLQQALQELAGPLQVVAVRYTELQGEQHALEAKQEACQRQRVELQNYIQQSQRSLAQIQQDQQVWAQRGWR